MWPFKRKKVYVDVEVIEPKHLCLDMFIGMELKSLAKQGLSIRSKCHIIHNAMKRYRKMGYTFKG
jgi:hypothetical protein